MYWFLVLRDRGEQGSQNPVLFGWLLADGAQNRPAACCGEWALLALALCASQRLCSDACAPGFWLSGNGAPLGHLSYRPRYRPPGR